MEARRRRRFLERSSDVSGEESVSWRSRIYQKETTQEPSSNWRGEKADQRRSHAVSQNEDPEMTGSAGRRRRKGDDGGSNELAERLARRRAQRLEEQSENSSHDGSVDGSRLSDRRWSRDDSVRSVDSSDNGDVVDTGMSVRRTRRSKGDHFSNTTTTNNNSNNNGVNVMENGKNITHSGEVCRNGDGETHGTTARLSRHKQDEDAKEHYRWNSKDSANGISLSSDAGDIYSSSSSNRQSKRRTSSRLQSGDFDPSEVSGGPKSRPVHELSKDSAFSESREKSAEPRDIANSSNNANNSNNNSTTAQETLLDESASSALAYRARRIQDYINDCEDGQSGPRAAFSAAKDNQSDSTEPVSDDHQQRRRTRATGQSSSLDSGSRRLSADDENMAEKEGVVEDGFRARLRRMRGVEAEEAEGFKVISNSMATSSQGSTSMDSVHPPLRQAPGAPETDPRANHAERDQEPAGGHLELAVTCDTTTTTAPPEPERRRRRRVDKSALRKSPLNMDTGVTEELDDSTNSDSGLQDGKIRRRNEGSVVSQHASFWENPNSQQHAPASSSRVRTNIPTRYMGDLSAKISATRQKFSQPTTDSDKPATSVARTKLDTTTDVHLKTKKVDLGQLIQKFSGSESASEKSDTDADSWASSAAGGHRPWVRRQKAEEVNTSSEESEGARRTPERTQSLRHYGAPPADSFGLGSKLEKSASFRAEFASRRFAQKTSDSVVHVGGTKEVTPPKENAGHTVSSSAAGSSSAAVASLRALNTEKNNTKAVNITKDLSGTSSLLKGAAADVHSSKDASTRATFGSLIKNSSPEPNSGSNVNPAGLSGHLQTLSSLGSVPSNKDNKSSPTDNKVADLSSSAFMNRPWLNRTPGSTLQSQKDKLNSSDKVATVDLTISSKGQDSSKPAPEPGLKPHRYSPDSLKNAGLNSLDKSMELLSKVTEELDHPERPSSLPTSPLDLKSPKSRSPSIDEAQRYIKEVETSINSISSRGSPDKTKSPVRSSFPFRISGDGKTDESSKLVESGEQASNAASGNAHRELRLDQQQSGSKASHISRDLKSLERDVKVDQRPDNSVSLVSRDLKDSYMSRDPKSLERDAKVDQRLETPVSLASRDFKESHVSRDPKSLERDAKVGQPTVASDSKVSRDLTGSHLLRDSKSSERELKEKTDSPASLLSRGITASHISRDPKSSERETKADKQPVDVAATSRAPHNSSTHEPDFQTSDRLKSATDQKPFLSSSRESRSNERDLPRDSTPQDSDRSPQTAFTLSTSSSMPTFTTTAASSTLPSSSSHSTSSKPQDGGSKVSTEPEASSSLLISSGMRRTSSFKDPAELTEKRKGILKRTSSLKNRGDPSSHPVVDPQLARILLQRKQIVGDVLEEEDEKEDKEKKRTFSATDEIQENFKYSIQKAAELGKNPDEDDALKRMSVAERVQYMQTKLEEEKFSVTSSRSRSGLSTPRSRPVSGFITPSQFRYEETHQSHLSSSSSATSISGILTSGHPPAPASAGSRKNSTSSFPAADDSQPGSSAVSGPKLIEKLTEIAEASDAFQERRHRFQQRSRNDWRHQTQPVTLEEISAADSLETVSTFRALVRKKTSINAFDQLKDQGGGRQHAPLAGKKAEFPQHLPPPPKNQRRGRRLRHRTLPVTAEELNAVPEHQMLIMHPEWAKVSCTEDLEEKRDSGILSGSDVDLLQDQSTALTTDLDSGDREPSKMTISAKTSFFKGLEERSRADREKSASGAKRYILRKKRERSQTMPITDDEILNASETGEENSGGGTASSTRATLPEMSGGGGGGSSSRSRSTSISEDGEGDHEEDELTKLSLSEKVKLFSQLKDKEQQQPPPKVEAPVKRRGRKQPSRFSTQPVTSEEVEQAAAYSRISPLAMSLVKPPDPEILKGLPLKDQRELMAQHAEMFLSQSSLRSVSRSGSNTSLSQPSSRRASITTEDGGGGGVKPDTGEEERNERRAGILKDKSASNKELHEIRGILRSEPVKAPSEPEVHSILKGSWDIHHASSSSSSEPRGILKKAKSEDIPSMDSSEELKSILKHTDSDEEEKPGKPRSRSNSQPFGILKRETSPQPGEVEIKSILKTPSHENVPHLTSALRRGSNDSDSSAAGSGALRSALKHRGHNSESEEGQPECSAAAAASELRSALHKPHASTAGDNFDDANSHIHVDLTLTISSADSSHEASSRSGNKASSVSPKDHSPRSSLDRGDEGTVLSSARADDSAAAAAPLSSRFSPSKSDDKDTLKVPEDAEAKLGTSASEGEGESSAGELLDEPTTNRLRKKSRMNRATNSERYKTQPPELAEATSSTSTSEQPKRKYKYETRHKTQPITPGEMREAEAATPVSNLIKTPGGSISDRLNQLKASGNEDWKRRVERKDDIVASPDVVKLREKSGTAAPRPSSIADRLNELEFSKKTWQNRVEESDAKQFTVAAKSSNITESPLVNKLKNLPKKDGECISPLASPVTPTKEFIAKIPLPKDIVHDPTVKIQPSKPVSESEDKQEPVVVEVPNVSEELQTFFNVKSIDEINDKVDVTIDDFDNIFIESECILSSVHKIRPQRKTKASTHNPLKFIKVETLNEYLEVTSGVAEKELRRVKREGLAKDAGFAEAALAGLASKENFKQVELRRTDSGSSVHGMALEPFKDLMLFHIKGRRTVQTRLVEPHTRSVNSGDCYVLVTPDKVFHWEGQFANVIEKAKASEIASCIQTKKELCCKRASEVLTVYQNKDHYGNGKLFWSLLEGDKQSQVCGPDNEDELFEASITKSNMIYRLEGNALLPYTQYWGDLPRYEMLQKNEVIVFDFGTEFYLWQGKSVNMEQRKLGLKLAKQLFEKGYDYTESAINPLSPLRTEEHGGLPLKADKRPSWVIFGKVSQNMETILFREKFADWPDSSRMIGVKGLDLTGAENISKDILELKPYDAALMLPQNTSPVTLKLEGSDLGRGVKWSEDMQGFVKEQDIITIDVTTWHILEYEHSKLPQASHGQFHEGDTYVVRWQYMIASANLRNVKGAAKNIPKGRERCAYFFWQGINSTINEKGASALMTVELDEERGPQVRVLQGKEIPCFLNLFKGRMVVHVGKREDPTTSTHGSWRLFCLRGDYDNELCLVEIPVAINHLRSRSSFVFLNVNTGMVYIWHGAKSPKHIRENARKAMEHIKEKPPLEFSLHKNASITITEVEEGEERKEIWAALDSKDRSLYHSLLEDAKPYTHTLRLFHMSSVNMIFEVHEQLNPSRVPDLTTPFPFLQSDLYKAAQPALFLVDNDHEVYLWQGWFPVSSHDTDNVNTGSALSRFNMDRKCAMETTLHYCKVKNPAHPPPAYLVCAGVEPESFTSLFPVWIVDTIVQEISLEEGRMKGYKEKVSDVLHRLTKTKYTLAELHERPLPEGVDPLKLESYLEDSEFEEILGMNREEFYAHPAWKQRQLKQQAKLF